MTTTYTLPDLPFALDACEPWCSAETLELHHQKHHAAYVAGANRAVGLLELVDPADPTALAGVQESLAFNVSGHVLHSLFWESLAPTPSTPDGELMAAVADSFASAEQFSRTLAATAVGIHGSGWAAVVWEPTSERLHVVGIRDHQHAQLTGASLLAVIDVWEHAYYLQYRSDRAAWVSAVIEHLAWDHMAHRLNAARMLVAT